MEPNELTVSVVKSTFSAAAALKGLPLTPLHLPLPKSWFLAKMLRGLICSKPKQEAKSKIEGQLTGGGHGAPGRARGRRKREGVASASTGIRVVFERQAAIHDDGEGEYNNPNHQRRRRLLS